MTKWLPFCLPSGCAFPREGKLLLAAADAGLTGFTPKSERNIEGPPRITKVALGRTHLPSSLAAPVTVHSRLESRPSFKP